MTYKKENNFAFIDGQNLHMGIQELGWKLDLKRFRKYLREKYSVRKVFYFIGYMPKYKSLYKLLRKFGYLLCFKEIVVDKYGNVKGNVDADLVLKVMLEYKKFDKAMIISSDGDFAGLVRHLYQDGKLKSVLSSHRRLCSLLLKKSAKGKIDYLADIRHLIEYTK